MGLFRAVFASVVFLDLAFLAVDFSAWYTETGFLPSAQLQRWTGDTFMFSLLSNITDSRVTAVFFALTMLAAFLTAIGLFTRISSVALLVGVVSLHHRCPEILHSGDTLIRAMLFFIALAPSGKACSIDRLIALWKGEASRDHEQVSLWPQKMMQVQLAVVYITTVWHKSFGSTWLDGTANYYPPNLDEFDRFPVPGFFDVQPMLAITTWGALIVELALGTLVFNRQLRKPVLIAGVILHAGIEYRFNIPMFAMIITPCYLTFYYGEDVVGWSKQFGDRLARWRIDVKLPKSVFSQKLCAVQAADPLMLVKYNSESRGSMRGVLLRSFGAWPLLLWPPAWKYLRSPFTIELTEK